MPIIDAKVKGKEERCYWFISLNEYDLPTLPGWIRSSRRKKSWFDINSKKKVKIGTGLFEIDTT